MKYLGGCSKEYYAVQECMNQEVGLFIDRGAQWHSGRASDSGVQGSILTRITVLCPLARHIYSPKSTGNTQEVVWWPCPDITKHWLHWTLSQKKKKNEKKQKILLIRKTGFFVTRLITDAKSTMYIIYCNHNWAASRENQQCGFWPGLTQTRLYSYWRRLEAWNFVFRK